MCKINETKLLIIDDDDLIRETLKDVFQEKGYIVDFASSGHEAINKFEQITLDVIFIDLLLPDMNGMTLLEEFKLIHPESLCFIMTGYGTLQNVIKALKDGVDGYFLKPLIIQDVIKQVQILLEKKVLQQELKKSEEKYHEAYDLVNFYKNLFLHDISNIWLSII